MQNVGFHNDNDVFIRNNIIDSIGTSDGSMGTTHDSIRMEETNNHIDESRTTSHDINIRIFRFTFTDVFMNALYIFAKVHQYDHRKVFKEAWEIWLEENENIVASEVKRLTELNYEGDILDKMFKSARYYFRKKSTEKKAPAERREYVAADKELIEAMDKHILEGIESFDYKPSDGFEDFCKTNLDILKKQVNFLCQCGMKNSDEIKDKIKKTYKNRYFLISIK